MGETPAVLVDKDPVKAFGEEIEVIWGRPQPKGQEHVHEEFTFPLKDEQPIVIGTHRDMAKCGFEVFLKKDSTLTDGCD
jgi:hypothetical protein